MSYDRRRVDQFVAEASQLEPLDFKTLYFWLTEAMPRTWAGFPRGVPQHLITIFHALGPWEKANSIDGLRRHMEAVMREDFKAMAAEARRLEG